MFPSNGLFKGILCPNIRDCQLPNCLFSHDIPRFQPTKELSTEWNPTALPDYRLNDPPGADHKRRKLDDGSKIPVDHHGPKLVAQDAILVERRPTALGKPKDESGPRGESNDISHSRTEQPPSVGERVKTKVSNGAGLEKDPSGQSTAAESSTRSSATKVSNQTTSSSSPGQPQKKDRTEALNPRLIKNIAVSASHELRHTCLGKIHEQVVRLNWTSKREFEDFKKKSSGNSRPGPGAPTKWTNFFINNASALVRIALDEEEKIARENPSVYGNVVRNRIKILTKMSPETWRKEFVGPFRQQTAAPSTGASSQTQQNQAAIRTIPSAHPRPVAHQPVESLLTPAAELAFLSSFHAHLTDSCESHGYVLAPPTTAELDDAKSAVQAAAGWERCDRCDTHFQIFEQRRESDGELTSGGKCRYHWGKRRRINRIPIWTCCHQSHGQGEEAQGCVVAPRHVFTVKDPKRLGLVEPFIVTGSTEASTHIQKIMSKAGLPWEETSVFQHKKAKALALDCEMCYTTKGLELVRLTATSWPSGSPVLDVLVRPRGIVLDFNTRFSGVTASAFVDAEALEVSSCHLHPPYAPLTESESSVRPSKPGPLRILPSPAAARSTLLELLHNDGSIPLIGHGLENDLLALRLCHHTVVDTALLFKHPAGLPVRHRLQKLAADHLGWKIQGPIASTPAANTEEGDDAMAGSETQHADKSSTGNERDQAPGRDGNHGLIPGHDSLEDARAAGELVRWRMAYEWKILASKGWSVVGPSHEEDAFKSVEFIPPGNEKDARLPIVYGAEVGSYDGEKVNNRAGSRNLDKITTDANVMRNGPTGGENIGGIVSHDGEVDEDEIGALLGLT